MWERNCIGYSVNTLRGSIVMDGMDEADVMWCVCFVFLAWCHSPPSCWSLHSESCQLARLRTPLSFALFSLSSLISSLFQSFIYLYHLCLCVCVLNFSSCVSFVCVCVRCVHFVFLLKWKWSCVKSANISFATLVKPKMKFHRLNKTWIG